MRILIDVDGVLANFLDHCATFSPELAAILANEAERGLTPYHDAFVRLESTKPIWDHIASNPGLMEQCPELANVQHLDSLRALGEVIAVTSPAHTPTWAHERANWLRVRGFSKDQIISTSRKDVVHGNVFIDDNPDHCLAWWKEQARIGSWQPRVAILWVDPTYRFDAPPSVIKHASHFKTVLAECIVTASRLEQIRSYISAP